MKKKKNYKGKPVLLITTNRRGGNGQWLGQSVVLIEPPEISELSRSVRAERRRRRQRRLAGNPSVTGKHHLRRNSLLDPVPVGTRTHQRTQTERQSGHITGIIRPSAASPYRRHGHLRSSPPPLRRLR
ncbi:hypothetical protein U1Q18_023014 [Sarracenia purpurea var. burkii]